MNIVTGNLQRRVCESSRSMNLNCQILKPIGPLEWPLTAPREQLEVVVRNLRAHSSMGDKTRKYLGVLVISVKCKML
jgi:hypothetical protein